MKVSTEALSMTFFKNCFKKIDYDHRETRETTNENIREIEKKKYLM